MIVAPTPPDEPRRAQPQEETTLEELVAAVDLRMLEAKRAKKGGRAEVR